MTTEPATPAAIYVRISQDIEDTGLGVARQKEDCEALAAQKGWEVIDVYEDNDISATSGKPRPAYRRMTRDIEAGQVRAIAVWDVDRLTRTPRELEDVIDWADRHGLALASVGGDIDLATPQGRMTARIKGNVARHESEQLSRRITRKAQQLAESGRYVGKRPFGWDFDADGGLTINKAEAAVVREAYRRVLAGEANMSVVNDFNDRGITTRTGGHWRGTTFRAMLLRWMNCGVRIHQGKEIGPGNWEPIVTRAEHERLVARLQDPARRSSNRGTAVRYLLSHIAQCAQCGQNLIGTKARHDGKRRQPFRYKCNNRGCFRVARNMDDIDAYVTGAVLKTLELDGVRILGGDVAAYEAAQSRIEEVEAKLAIAADQFTDDLITADQFRRITARLRPQLDDARGHRDRSVPAEGLEAFTGADARKGWEQASIEQRRTVLRALTEAGMTISVDRAGGGHRLPGQGPAPFNPDTVQITWTTAEETA